MRPGFLQPERVPFVDVQIVPASPAPDAAAITPSAETSALQVFERLAREPGASVETIERLMALWERGEAQKAAARFAAAMTAAQAQMRPIAADADNPQTKSRYASYAALDRALRPIYTTHGFALSFNTGEAPAADTVRVLCDVTHLGGCVKGYHVDMPADGKGAKGGDVMTRTHATGAAIAYGMRYLLKMVFNVAVGDADDDGNSATARQPRRTSTPVQHPAGYLKWLDTLRTAAQAGLVALERAWYDAPKAFRQHLDQTNLPLRAELKAIAARQIVTAS